MGLEQKAFNIADLREMARKRLPKGLFEHLDRGVEDDSALMRNRRGFDDIRLQPRNLRGVTDIATETTLFGRKMAAPFAIAPTGGNGLFWLDGDLALARAAAKAGVPFTISTASSIDVEDLAAVGGETWFQLYYWQDHALSHAVLDRAWDCGVRVLMLTVDIAVPPNREFNSRNGFQPPFRIGARNFIDIASHPRWLMGVPLRYALRGGMPLQANLPKDLRSSMTGAPPAGAMFRNDNITWDSVARLREIWKGALLIKGVLHPADAEQAMTLGCDGVVVSNHGGRALDGAIAPIEALPGIVGVVGERGKVLLDSGVHRGADIAKALALGASAVLAGRAPLYGLGTAGEEGVSLALHFLREELVRVMGQSGCRSIAEITSDLIAPNRSFPN